ncbi:peptidase [Clavibacter michiganensis]|uniref:Peptidase n=1 Tax=Clavibacter michiganensis TaxID=28447 RepID=A0A2S5VXE8_9MICO|nr:peptidase [Clavibacter michiganensis]PPF70982.1 peptidase [Clavibacter michiganensis]
MTALSKNRVSVPALLLLLAILAGLSSVALPAHAAASMGTASPDDTGRSFSDAEASDAVNSWTPEALAAATDLDAPGDAVTAPASGATEQSLIAQGPGTYEPVYWIGRIYFDVGEKQYSCSGSSIRSDSQLVVATAAHCLYDHGDWSTRVVFIPAWDGANKPLGVWGAFYYSVSRDWRTTEDPGHDAAFIKMMPKTAWNGTKEYLAPQAGAPAPAFDAATPGLHFEAFGYRPLSGYVHQPLYTCAGEGRHFRGLASIPEFEIAGCDPPGGASGGPVYHASTRGPNGTQYGVITETRRARDGSPLLIFVPWGQVEYSLYRSVDLWPR